MSSERRVIEAAGSWRAVAIGIVLLASQACADQTGAPPPAPDPPTPAKTANSPFAVPTGVLDIIETSFPGFRIPSDSERIPYWSGPDAGEQPPWAAKGDFDGNGLADLVLIVLSDKEWKLVAFNQIRAGVYEAVPLSGGPVKNPGANVEYPQEILLATIPKGTTKTYETFSSVNKVSFDADAVEMVIVEKSMSIFQWKDGKYSRRYLGGE